MGNSHEKTENLELSLRNLDDLFRVMAIKMLWLGCAINSVCSAMENGCDDSDQNEMSFLTQASDGGTTDSLLKTFEVARAWARRSRAYAKRTGRFVYM